MVWTEVGHQDGANRPDKSSRGANPKVLRMLTRSGARPAPLWRWAELPPPDPHTHVRVALEDPRALVSLGHVECDYRNREPESFVFYLIFIDLNFKTDTDFSCWETLGTV